MVCPTKFNSTDAYFAGSKKFKNLNFLRENRETYILKNKIKRNLLICMLNLNHIIQNFAFKFRGRVFHIILHRTCISFHWDFRNKTENLNND